MSSSKVPVVGKYLDHDGAWNVAIVSLVSNESWEENSQEQSHREASPSGVLSLAKDLNGHALVSGSAKDLNWHELDCGKR